MRTTWKQLALLVALALCAYLVPISTNGAWILLAPLATVFSYLAGRHVASLLHGLLAFGAGTLAAALTLVVSSPVSLLTFALNILTGVVLFALLPWWIGRARRRSLIFRAQERRHVVVQAELRERARIAEAMHDQLGHDLALLALQSGGLQVSLDKGTPAYGQAAKIRKQADEAIEHLHQIIGVLHAAGDPAPMEPVGNSLNRLIEQTRAKGMAISFSQLGSPPIGSGAELLHQVVQETLTNAAKYAPGATVDIELDTRANPITVQISNPLTAEAAPARLGATGLASLRAALEAQGGSLLVRQTARDFSLTAAITRSRNNKVLPLSLPAVKRPSRRALLLLPIIAVTVIASGLLLLQDATNRATALHPKDFQRLSVGMSQDEVAQIVHAQGLDEPLPVIEEVAPPPGAKCHYYAARTGVLDLGSEMFRLCFTADVLTSTDHLYPAS
ncbi:sensor histidine kinase [Glutamicibacter arilaitensis]|uniref:sensor histidine kinase n=1 Tax=Glutamicibacter arilaitensis TaxID=256701 RepID=UPI00384B41F3